MHNFSETCRFNVSSKPVNERQRVAYVFCLFGHCAFLYCQRKTQLINYNNSFKTGISINSDFFGHGMTRRFDRKVHRNVIPSYMIHTFGFTWPISVSSNWKMFFLRSLSGNYVYKSEYLRKINFNIRVKLKFCAMST